MRGEQEKFSIINSKEVYFESMDETVMMDHYLFRRITDRFYHDDIESEQQANKISRLYAEEVLNRGYQSESSSTTRLACLKKALENIGLTQLCRKCKSEYGQMTFILIIDPAKQNLYEASVKFVDDVIFLAKLYDPKWEEGYKN